MGPHADPPTRSSPLQASTLSFLRWLDNYGEHSYDPYDLWSTRLGALAKGLYYRRRVVGKLAAAPFVAIDAVTPQLRRIAVKRRRYAIADAHYALAFLRLGRMDPDAGHFERARSFLSALDAARSPLYDEPAWGYPFDWPSRHFMYRAESPLIPTMPYAYEAFAAGFDTLGDERWLDVAHGAATFVAERIPVTPVAPGVEASAYSPFDHRQVVNASAYRGFMLISAGIRFDRTDWRTAGAANIAFVLRSQQSDGSWPYSVDGGDNFIDNFHTCFVLKNLAKVQAATPDDELEDAIAAGYAFYLARLLDEQGLPRPYAQRPRLTLHRRDLYDYAEGINVALLLRDRIPGATETLRVLVDDLIQRWALPDGHFVTRELVVGRNTVPYHRWAQSQAFHALVCVQSEDALSV